MQIQEPDFDIKITMGQPQNHKNLLSLVLTSTNRKQEIIQAKKTITEIPQDLLQFVARFQVHEGRAKEAREYFEEGEGEGMSPLQILFAKRPEGDDCENFNFKIIQGQNTVSLYYGIKYGGDIFKQDQIDNALGGEKCSFENRLEFELKGSVKHNNQNRANVKVQYVNLHTYSNKFFLGKIIDGIEKANLDEELFNQMAEQIGPIYELIKKARTFKTSIKMDSFSSINRFYNKTVNEGKQTETKNFNYVNKGIFKQKVEVTTLFQDKLLLKMTIRYDSEDVLMRLIKVYYKIVTECLD